VSCFKLGDFIVSVQREDFPSDASYSFMRGLMFTLTEMFNGITKFIHPDCTDEIHVGYTTTIEADTFVSPLIPDLELQHLKTLTVTSSFTVDEPTTNGHCEYYLTVTGAGGYTVTAGTGVGVVGTLPSLATGTNYLLNVRRFGASKTAVQVVKLT